MKKMFEKKIKKQAHFKILNAIKVDDIDTDESMKDLRLEDFLDENEIQNKLENKSCCNHGTGHSKSSNNDSKQ